MLKFRYKILCFEKILEVISDFTCQLFVFPFFIGEGWRQVLSFKFVFIESFLILSDFELLIFDKAVFLWDLNVDIFFEFVDGIEFGWVSFSIAFPSFDFELESLVVGLEVVDKFFVFLIFLKKFKVFLVHCVQFLLVLYLPILSLLKMLLLTFQLHSQLIDLFLISWDFSAILILEAHVFNFDWYFLVFGVEIFLIGSDWSSDVLCRHHIVVAFWCKDWIT